jgi:hypothetical protein
VTGARDQYAALVPIRERVQGPEHPETVITRNNLARWTAAAGDTAAAAAVPPQHGSGRDQPVHPQPSRQEPDQHGEDRPVGPVEPGPRMGASQHGDLMPQHEQLGVLGGR